MDLSYYNSSSTILMPSDDPPTEINSTYVIITGAVVFGFPVITMAIFCFLRIQLEKRKRYRGVFLEDRLEAAGANSPIIPNIEEDQFGSSNSSDQDNSRDKPKFFRLLFNFIRMEQTSSSENSNEQNSTLNYQA